MMKQPTHPHQCRNDVIHDPVREIVLLRIGAEVREGRMAIDARRSRAGDKASTDRLAPFGLWAAVVSLCEIGTLNR